jgi:hypothetical protein
MTTKCSHFLQSVAEFKLRNLRACVCFFAWIVACLHGLVDSPLTMGTAVQHCNSKRNVRSPAKNAICWELQAYSMVLAGMGLIAPVASPAAPMHIVALTLQRAAVSKRLWALQHRDVA